MSYNRIFKLTFVFLTLLIVNGCFAGKKRQQPSPTSPIKVVKTLEYYPRFVKGYEDTFPPRRVVVLKPVDEREYPPEWANDHADFNGNTAIGVVRDAQNRVIERLYSPPFVELVHKALAQAATEAGLRASLSPESDYAKVATLNAGAYVLASKIKRCWVEQKSEIASNNLESTRSWAEFDLDATIYKAPFHIPFWQSKSASVFYDPPPDTIDPGFSSETALYDDPAQVLSVALTRAVAGIFSRYDLRNLIQSDQSISQ